MRGGGAFDSELPSNVFKTNSVHSNERAGKRIIFFGQCGVEYSRKWSKLVHEVRQANFGLESKNLIYRFK